MLGAVDTFTSIANATAAVYAKCPAFATYHVKTNLFFFNKDTVIERDVTVRTADQVAVVYDATTKKDSLKPPFPAPPNFDGLSNYAASGTFSASTSGSRDVDFRIGNIMPLTYRDIATHADAVAKSIRGYSVAFAPDTNSDIGHLILTPVSDATRGAKHHLSDVYYNPSTLLPSRVISVGPDDTTIDATYQMTDGNWLLHTLYFHHTWHGILLFAKLTGDFTATYDNFRFSETAPDP